MLLLNIRLMIALARFQFYVFLIPIFLFLLKGFGFLVRSTATKTQKSLVRNSV